MVLVWIGDFAEGSEEIISVRAAVSGPIGLKTDKHVVELGWDQAERAREIAREAGFASVEVRPDLARIERILVAR